jgi:hypothetical protein
MHIGSKVFSQQDKQGNIISMRAFFNENKEYVYASVHLKLIKEKRLRLIGYVDIPDNCFHCVRDSAKHYHYKTKGFGFNWGFLDGPFVFMDKISMRLDDDKLYVFPKSVLKEKGIFLNFKEQGFELQKFLPFEFIRPYEKPLKDDTKPSYAVVTKA